MPIAEGGEPNPLDNPADGFEAASDIDTRTLKITFFPDEAAQSLRTADLTLSQLADGIAKQAATSKMELPWLKLAIFGDKRSDKNCLRTNANLVQITGIEAEHDLGEMSFDTAIAVMRKARIRSLLYTTPSYVPATKERWRILVPLSQNHPPKMREKLVARINGLFGGTIAPESFTLSQAHLFGHVDNSDHRVEVVDGDFLDLRDDLDAGAMFKESSRRPGDTGVNGGGQQQHRSRADDDPEPVDRDKIEAALNVISSDCSYEIWRNVGGALYRALGDSGFELFDRWSAKATAKYNADECRERWRGVRSLREHTARTIYYLADQADPGWRGRHDAEVLRRGYDSLRDAYRASTGGDAAGAGASAEASGSASAGASGSAGTAGAGNAQPNPPLISATPFLLRDPKSIPMRQWLYGHHLIRKFGSATIAPGAVGKSSLMIVEALAIVTGRSLLGIPPRQRARVWLWNGEDPLEEIERRIAAACLHFGITAQEIEGWLFVDSGRNSEIVIATHDRNGVTIAVPMVEALLKTIRDNQIDVVQIDPFISSHRVPENDNNAIDAVAKTWTGIADATNTAIDLAHHSRKTGGAEVTVEDGRGAVALLNAVRSARVLNTMTADEAAKAGVTGHRNYFKLVNGKQNLAPPPDKVDWCHLHPVGLGNGPPNNPLNDGDKVGVVTAWQWPNPLDGVTGRDFDKVAAIIRAGEWRHHSQAAAWVGFGVAKALRLDITQKADKAKVMGLLKIWLGMGSLVVVKRLDPVRRETKDFVEVAPED